MAILKESINTLCVESSLASNDRKKILVIDDDPFIRLFFESSIIGSKYRVITAPNGVDALNRIAKASEFSIDLIIIDYRLPDVSGIEVLREIAKLASPIPAIFLTGYGNEEIAMQALRCGACDYVKKPFDASDLAKRIEFHVTRKLSDPEGGRKVIFDESCNDTLYRHAASSGQCSYQMQKVLKYIDENYMKKINLKDVAQIACMSKYHFSRTFKQEVGATYQDYLNNRRVEMAKSYLKSGCLMIKEIAFAVGYNDVRNFIYIFKKVTDSTPSEFKERALITRSAV